MTQCQQVSTYFCKFLQSRNLYSPTFIICQVKMQNIQLIRCHHLKKAHDCFFAVEIASNINMISTMAHPWCILDGNHWQSSIGCHAQEGLNAPENAGTCTSWDMNLLFLTIHLEVICFSVVQVFVMNIYWYISLSKDNRTRWRLWCVRCDNWCSYLTWRNITNKKKLRNWPSSKCFKV